MSDKPLLAYFGHHKCATTWINTIIRQTCARLGQKCVSVGNPSMFDKDLKAFVDKNRIGFLSYGNADFTYVHTLDNFKGFHVIRDPRDIVVSAYFSHLYSHPTTIWLELVKYREKLQKVTKEEGIFFEMELMQWTFRHLSSWDYSQPHVLEIRMEDLIQHPYEVLVEAFRFLGLVDEAGYSLRAHMKRLTGVFLMKVIKKIRKKSRGLFPFHYRLTKLPVAELLAIIYHNGFSVQTKGRRPGEEDVKSHYRKGVAGDWVNHFNVEHKTYFKERYNDLLVKLGYEKDSDW